jgi:hypothetical protein
MSVNYLKALEMWDPEVTTASIELWHSTVQGLLTKCVQSWDPLLISPAQSV